MSDIDSVYVLPTNEDVTEGRLSDVGFWEAFKATWGYQWSPVIDRISEQVEFFGEGYNPEFDPFTEENYSGYEDYLNELARARNAEHLAWIKGDIDRRLANKQTLTDAGFWNAGVWVGALTDPLNASFAIPIWGQLGLMARGGMTVGQAARASFKGSLAAGAVSEGIRAPFDRTNTFTETGLNMATMTAAGTILGSVPAMVTGYRRSIAKQNEVYEPRPVMNESVDGFKITNKAADMPPPPKGSRVEISIPAKEIARLRKIVDDIRVDENRINRLVRPIEGDDNLVALRAEAKAQGIQPTVLQTQLNKELPNVIKARKAAEKELKDAEAVVAKETKSNAAYDAEQKAFKRKMAQRKAVFTKGKDIRVDDELIAEEFNKRVWTSEEVRGSSPFRETDFKTPSEWRDYSVNREIVRRNNPRKPGESQAAYYDRTAKEAYNRMTTGYGVADTAYTKSVFYKFLSTPGKRIMSNGTGTMKRDYHLLAGVDQYRMAGIESGKSQHQSVSRAAKTHIARGIALNEQMQKLWALDVLNREQSSKILGYNTDALVAKRMNAKSYEDWFATVVEGRLQKQGKKFDASLHGEHYNAAVERLDQFFKEYRQELVELNIIADGEKFLQRAADYQDFVDTVVRETGGNFRTAKQAEAVAKAEEAVKFYKDLYELRYNERYAFPIYYDKRKLLSGNGKHREALERIFADWIRNHPIKKLYNEETRRFEAVPSSKSPEAIAKDAVAAILEEGNPETHLDVMAGPTKGKHLRHRMIDIPEYLISDYIIKEPRVIQSYVSRVGKRIEFHRNFGQRSIDDILEDHDQDMIAAGFPEKKRQRLRQDFLFDYERVMGEYVKNPDRWDAQAGSALKEIAGMAYLDAAAVASLTDVGNIMMEHGPRKLFDPFRTETDRILMAKAKKELVHTGEAYELSQAGAQQRIIQDNVEGINPNLQERIFNPITRAYYNIPVLGNGLGAITYYFKRVDHTFRSSKYMNTIIDMQNGTAKRADVIDLKRAGLTDEDAKIIASYPYEKGNRYVYANSDNWPMKTERDREIYKKWQTALNIGMGNTIIHANAFDKPRIMDGVLYAQKRGWMDLLPGDWSPDPRASTANIKMVRIESHFMTMPFQFFNFVLGATNRITAGMFDPMKQHRLVGGMTLLALGYGVLRLKNDDWWFDARSNAEVFQRVVDQSGLFGVYNELAYIATHAAVGTGMMEADETLLRPKYNPNVDDVLTEPLGAAPGLLWAWTKAGKAWLEGDTDEAAEQFRYNYPTTPAIALYQDWFQ